MFKKLLFLLGLLFLCFYSAAAQDGLTLVIPDIGVVQGERISVETFDLQDAWEQYSNPNGVELAIENGVYRAYTMNPGYVWGLNQEQHGDVILEVEATPLTPNFENGFGVICRADTTNDGDGYYFMINADGYYSILKGQGQDMLPLINWSPSRAIHPEIDRNVIRAVCVNTHLALYVNDQLVAETQDSTYSQGYAGLSVAAGNTSDVDVAFDNLVTYQANIVEIVSR